MIFKNSFRGNYYLQKISLVFLLVVILTSCNSNHTSTKPSSVDKVFQDSSNIFIALFPTINEIDLHIYSPREDTIISSDKFIGSKIDKRFYKYLFLNGQQQASDFDTYGNYYSCFKFPLSNLKTGLIIRRPSQYSESAVDLYTWDNKLRKVTDVFNLSDAFGDEGWHFVQDAWISKINNDTFWDIVTRRKDFDQDLDDSTKISRSDSTLVYLGNGETFTKATKSSVDTSNYQLKYWTEK